MKGLKNLLILIIFIIFVKSCYGQNNILINEFLIDPQPQSVEIFNSGSESADISDWIIDDSGGTTFYTIPKDSVIFPNQCLIFSSDFNLNKTSADTIKLIDKSQQLMDFFAYKSSSGSGVSYFRLPDGSIDWTTGSANLGFYNQTNISCLITPTQIPTVIPTSTSTPIQPTPTDSPTPYTLTPSHYSLIPISYDNIYISEAMVNPSTGEKEWVEIYNNNDFSVSLNNWYIDDLENAGSSLKIFSLEISGKSYAVFNLSSSMFNNDGDSVRLLDFNKNLKDDFEYQKSEQGKTFGRTSLDSDDFCLQEPSYNSANNPCTNPTLTIITSVKTGKTNLSPTSTNFDVPARYASQSEAGGSIHRSINYPTGAVLKNYDNGEILGISNKSIINVQNNKDLINLLSFLSFFYSFLAIVSILIKSKLLIKYDLAS